MTKYITLLIFAITVLSCSSEKINLSPVYSNLENGSTLPTNDTSVIEKSDAIFYSSELTNQISTIPSFSDPSVNKEITNLKYNIKEYVYAIQAYNINGKDVALVNLEKSYKKIQRLRKSLKPDENEIINRYLVKIKSKITQIEATQPKSDSLSIKQ